MEQDISVVLESLIPITNAVSSELTDAVASNDEAKMEEAFSSLLQVKLAVQQLKSAGWPMDITENNNFLTIKSLLLWGAKAILHTDNPNKVVWANRVIEIARKLTRNVGD